MNELPKDYQTYAVRCDWDGVPGTHERGGVLQRQRQLQNYRVHMRLKDMQVWSGVLRRQMPVPKGLS